MYQYYWYIELPTVNVIEGSGLFSDILGWKVLSENTLWSQNDIDQLELSNN